MICKNCGKENENTTKFCVNCGTKLEEETVETPVAEAHVAEAPVAEEATVADEAPVAEDTEITEEAPKKKSKKGLIIGIIVAILAFCGVVVALNFAAVKNFFSKTFSSTEEYFKSVETKSLDNDVSKFDNAIDTIKSMNPKTNALGLPDKSESKKDITLELSDEITSYISTAAEADLSFLKKTDLNMVTSSIDDRVSIDMSLSLNGSEPISLQEVVDISDDTVYMTIPDLSEKTLAMKIEDSLGISLSDIYSSGLGPAKILEVLPDGKTAEKILNRYLDIVVNKINMVEMSDKEVKASGLTEDCTVLTAEISEKDAMDIAKKLLETFKEDEEVLGILQKLVVSLPDEEMTIDEMKADLNEEYDALVEEIKENDFDGDEKLIYTVYANNKGDVVGRHFEFEDIAFEYICLEDGDVKAVEIVATEGKTEMFKAVISGTEKDSVFNGDIELYVSGLHAVNAKIENFDCAKGLFGKITIAPSDAAKKLLPTVSGEIEESLGVTLAELGVSLPDISLVLDFKESEKHDDETLKMEFKSAGKNVIALNLHATMKSIDKIDIPADALDMSKEANQIAYTLSMDLEGFMSKLPEGLVEVVGKLMASMEEDEYYYDDEYYYEDDENALDWDELPELDFDVVYQDDEL